MKNYIVMSDELVRALLSLTDASNNDLDILRSKAIDILQRDISAYGAYINRVLARMDREQKKLTAQEFAVLAQLTGETVLVVRPGCHAWQWIAAQAMSARTGLAIEIREVSDLTDAGVIVAVGGQPATVIAQLTAMVLRGAAADLLLAGEGGEIASLKSGVIAQSEMYDPLDMRGDMISTANIYASQARSGLRYDENKD